MTVWSFQQKRIVARGQGHRSWITVVAFDPFTTLYSSSTTSSSSQSSNKKEGSETITSNGVGSNGDSEGETKSATDFATCYRLGSVAMDTQLCLWELTDDVLKQPYGSRSRASMVSGPGSPPSSLKFTGQQTPSGGDRSNNLGSPAATMTPVLTVTSTATPVHAAGSLTQRLASLTFSERKAGETDKSHRKNFSLGGRNSTDKSTIFGNASKTISGSTASSSSSTGAQSLVTGCADPLRLIGTQACPRLDEVPILEPLVCKKVAHERLTALIFREDCLITACQDGIVCTWARPIGPSHHTSNTTNTTNTTSESIGTMV